MASEGAKMSTMVMIPLVMTMLWGAALAQTGCSTALVSLAPCLNYITGSSTSPSSFCCSQLSNVVQSQPQCLCQVVNGNGPSFGITINQTQALALPSACKVQTPPASRCKAGNQASGGSAASPVGSPISSPADASTPEGSALPDAPSATPSTVSSMPSAGTGSKSTTGSTSAGNMAKVSTLFLLFLTSSVIAITRV